MQLPPPCLSADASCSPFVGGAGRTCSSRSKEWSDTPEPPNLVHLKIKFLYLAYFVAGQPYAMRIDIEAFSSGKEGGLRDSA